MEIITYTGLDIESLEKDWTELHSKDINAIFYNSYSFVAKWVKYSGKASDIQIITADEGHKLIGLCVILNAKSGIRYLNSEVSSFIGGIEFGDFLIDSTYKKPISIIKKLFPHLIRNTKSRLVLEKIPNNSLLLTYLLKSNQYNNSSVCRNEIPFVDINSWKDFNHYKKSCIPKNVNNYRNKLLREKKYEFKCYSGNQIPFDTIASIHKKRCNDSSRGDSIFDSKGDLYKELVALDNSFCFCILVEGEVVGYICAFYSNNTLYNWNTAHMPDYDSYSIGRVIYLDFVEYVFNKMETVNKIDLGGGRYPWKFELTPHFSTTYEFRLNTKHTKLFNFVDSLEYGLRGFFKK